MSQPRVTAAEYAAMRGVAVQQVYQKAKRHFVEKRADGTFSRADLDQAWIEGAAQDKARLTSEESNLPGDDLRKAKIRAQVRKLEVEISILESERDAALGKLVDVDKALATLCRIHGDIAGRITTWREASAAKRPELRREVEELAADLNSRLAEDVTL